MALNLQTRWSRSIQRERRILLVGMIATTLATVINLLIRTFGRRLVDIPSAFEPLATPWPVIQNTVAYSVAALAVYGLVQRLSSEPARTFLMLSAAGLSFSFIPLLGLSSAASATTAGLLLLAIMHLATAAIIVPLMLRSGH